MPDVVLSINKSRETKEKPKARERASKATAEHAADMVIRRHNVEWSSRWSQMLDKRRQSKKP